MTQTHWILAETLRRHGQKVPALARASGLSKNTVYDIVNGKSQAVTLETLDKLMSGLEALTGASVTVGELIGRDTSDPYAHLFVNAKPFDWEEAKKSIPNWTPEERAENDRMWRLMEAEKEARRRGADFIQQQLDEILGAPDMESDPEPAA